LGERGRGVTQSPFTDPKPGRITIVKVSYQLEQKLRTTDGIQGFPQC